DVDYLPIWADYSWPSRPARLIWHGLSLREDWNNFFGAVVIFNKADFEQVNGFPNSYWGWGPEDLELSLRFKLSGMDFDRRDGTYEPLAHQHAGFVTPGLLTEEARRKHAVFEDRKARLKALMKEDGLSSLTFKLVETRSLNLN